MTDRDTPFHGANWIEQASWKALPRVQESLRGLTDQNFRYHFTPLAFDFVPGNQHEKDRFVQKAQQRGWSLTINEDQSLHAVTGHGENITQNGLEIGTSVATMPTGDREEAIKKHPRLYLEALRQTVRDFSKHAIPYKGIISSNISGLITNLNSGLVIVDSSVPAKPKGQFDRTVPNSRALLKPTTHLLTSGANKESILDIVTFSIPKPIEVTNRKWKYLGESLMYLDIQNALLQALPVHIGRVAERGGRTPDPLRAVKTVEMFNAVRRYNP